MSQYIQAIFARLEDPKLPLIGPNVFLMKIGGIILPKGVYRRFVYYFLIVQLIYFVATQQVDNWIKRKDVPEILKNLKHNLVAVTTILKIITFILWQKEWLKLLDFITKADNKSRLSEEEDDKKIIKNYTKYCRKVSYFYWIMLIFTMIAIIIHPFMKYVTMPTYRAAVNNGTEHMGQISEHWTPFNQKKMPGYAVAVLSEIIITIYAGAIVAAFDSNVVVIMVFFCGELELLAKGCTRIFDDDDDKGIREKIKQCHLRHMDLIKYSSSFDSCLSPVMFFYTIVTSFTLCASLYEITLETDYTQNLLTAQYASFEIIQLLFYCWHGNEVLFMSQAPLRGMYESGWYKHSKYGKDVILLTAQLDKKVIFTAGPFVQFTVNNFINIMKGSYSYFTIINNIAK